MAYIFFGVEGSGSPRLDTIVAANVRRMVGAVQLGREVPFGSVPRKVGLEGARIDERGVGGFWLGERLWEKGQGAVTLREP